MKDDGGDSYGSTDPGTPYEGQHDPPPKGGVAKSAWAVAFLAGFLILVGIWFLLEPSTSTDPIPAGAGNGVQRLGQ
jgi:hypothetical protein